MVENPIQFAQGQRNQQTAALKNAIVPAKLKTRKIELSKEIGTVDGEIQQCEAYADTLAVMSGQINGLVTRCETLAIRISELEHVMATAPAEVDMYLGIAAFDNLAGAAMTAEIDATVQLKIFKRVHSSVRKELIEALAQIRKWAAEHSIPPEYVPSADSPRFSGLLIPSPSPELLESAKPLPVREKPYDGTETVKVWTGRN